MNRRPPRLDPDDPASADLIEAALAESLVPLPMPAAASTALRARLVERARATRRRFVNVRHDEGHWHRLGDCVRFKLLRDATAARSVLVDLAPGGTLPMHRHHEHEECVVLRGSAQLGDLTVHAGDYHVAPAGSRHGQVGSRDGALLYLHGVPIGDRAEVARDLLTAWLPGKGPAPITVRADAGRWEDLAPGVATKALWRSGDSHSLLVRMKPGASLSVPGADDAERLLLEGEIFVGDTLLRAGDYQCAGDDLSEVDIASDVGALFFMRATSAVPLPAS